MLYFEKSQPAPNCLEIEKNKATGDYKCGCVLDRLRQDFCNKCYICECAQPHSINVEHFRPHRGNKELKFEWNNLFWSCAHCNNIKLDTYDNILDCTNPEDDIENKLKYEFKPFPFERVNIIELDDSDETNSTSDLIEAVFNGTTKLKNIESSNIRDSLLTEILKFQNYLVAYFKPTCDDEDKDFFRRKIKSHLNKSSNFTSFKRWIVKENPVLMEEFSIYMV